MNEINELGRTVGAYLHRVNPTFTMVQLGLAARDLTSTFSLINADLNDPIVADAFFTGVGAGYERASSSTGKESRTPAFK